MKVSWRCSVCGEVLTPWAAAERHADEHGGARLELQWPSRPCVCHPRDRLRDGEHPERCYRCHGQIPV